MMKKNKLKTIINRESTVKIKRKWNDFEKLVERDAYRNKSPWTVMDGYDVRNIVFI